FPPRQPFGFAGAAVRPTDKTEGWGRWPSPSRGGEALAVVSARRNGPRPAALGQQLLQRGTGRFIANAIDARRPEMALEGCQHGLRSGIVSPADGDAVAVLAERVLHRCNSGAAAPKRKQDATFGDRGRFDPMT